MLQDDGGSQAKRHKICLKVRYIGAVWHSRCLEKVMVLEIENGLTLRLIFLANRMLSDRSRSLIV